ncbi:DUF2423 domain-containing protein [Sporobolomyces salmoneus]|uniref:DUF2423 domain-containing protein n=1 Tax=Sporobolomyces salmoneus TaxID=183962 RepID=UPI0031754185
MAKSLRSKSKRHFRAVKREDPKSAYKMAEDIRMARLNDQLKKSALKPKALTDKQEWERKQEGFETDEEEEGDEPVKEGENVEGGMQVEGEPTATEEEEPKQKISTSGPRVSRREAYRSSKGFKVKQTPTTLFTARGEKKRMACKPKRRRG